MLIYISDALAFVNLKKKVGPARGQQDHNPIYTLELILISEVKRYKVCIAGLS